MHSYQKRLKSVPWFLRATNDEFFSLYLFRLLLAHCFLLCLQEAKPSDTPNEDVVPGGSSEKSFVNKDPTSKQRGGVTTRMYSKESIIECRLCPYATWQQSRLVKHLRKHAESSSWYNIHGDFAPPKPDHSKGYNSGIIVKRKFIKGNRTCEKSSNTSATTFSSVGDSDRHVEVENKSCIPIITDVRSISTEETNSKAQKSDVSSNNKANNERKNDGMKKNTRSDVKISVIALPQTKSSSCEASDDSDGDDLSEVLVVVEEPFDS